MRANAPTPLDRVLVDGITTGGIWFGAKPSRVFRDVEHRTSADGTLELGPLAPGEYRVDAGGGARRMVVRSGETTTLEVESP